MPSRAGGGVNEAALAQGVMSVLSQEVTEGQKREAVVTEGQVPADFTTADAEALGIKEQLDEQYAALEQLMELVNKPPAEALKELEPWGIQSEYDFNKLPLIAIDDPALVSASQRATGSGAQWPAGQVVRVTRRSAYTGVSVAYRLVVPTSAFGRTAATGGVVFEQEEEQQQQNQGVEIQEIDDELQATFPPITEERISEKTGKRLKDKVTVFNPASRKQTADRLRDKYPDIKFSKTEKGNTKLDDDVLEILGKKYPEAALLAKYQLLNKRLGQISEGKEAWVKHSQKFKDGRIHGSVITNSCVSGRCSHRGPNTAQIPRVGQPYGAECRALFYAPFGWVQVGADASGLELRALGAQLAYFDGGEYAKLVSTDGFDIHTHNAKLFGIFNGKGEIDKKTRELAKTMIYAVLYGAGAKKLGTILDFSLSEHEQQELGRETIDTFYKNLPAIKKLKDKVDERVVQRGYLTGIDGRHLQIRSRHSALNQLLQSTGAIAVKKATCILYRDLHLAGLKWGCHFAFVAHIHDEIQALVKPQHVSVYKDLAIKSFEKAGEFFDLKCPLTGEAKEGKNWMETH